MSSSSGSRQCHTSRSTITAAGPLPDNLCQALDAIGHAN